MVDITTGRVSSWPVDGRSASEAGPHPMARVDDGWLVVRFAGEDAIVDLFPNGGEREVPALADGDKCSRSAVRTLGGSQRRHHPEIATYGTKRIFGPSSFQVKVATVDDRLVLCRVQRRERAQFDTIDPLGSVQEGATIESTSVEVLASGGERLVYRDAGGLYVFDFTSRTSRLITAHGRSFV